MVSLTRLNSKGSEIRVHLLLFSLRIYARGCGGVHSFRAPIITSWMAVNF